MTEPDQEHADRIDRLIDESIDAGRAPAPPEDGDLRADLELQRSIDDSLKRQFDPGDVAAELALQRRIDDSLRRQFRPAEVRAPEPEAPAPIRMARAPWLRGLAVAAVLTLASAAVLLATGYAQRAWHWAAGAGPARTASLERVYREQVEAGVVLHKCETPAQFQDWVETNYDESVRPVLDASEPLTFVGWNYEAVISRYTGVMIGEARGEGVILVVDQAERDPGLTLGEGSGLNLFRREVGALVFYEVTPLAEPVFTPTLRRVVGEG